MSEYPNPPNPPQYNQDFIGQEMIAQSQLEAQKDIMLQRLDFEDIIIKLKYELLGFVWDDVNQRYVKSENCKQLMNDEGVARIVSFMRTMLNKSTFLSNLSEKQVCMICVESSLGLLREIFLNIDRWQINRDSIDTIYITIREALFINLLRPKDAGEREALGRTERVVRNYGPPQKKSIIPHLFGGGDRDRAEGYGV